MFRFRSPEFLVSGGEEMMRRWTKLALDFVDSDIRYFDAWANMSICLISSAFGLLLLLDDHVPRRTASLAIVIFFSCPVKHERILGNFCSRSSFADSNAIQAKPSCNFYVDFVTKPSKPSMLSKRSMPSQRHSSFMLSSHRLSVISRHFFL